MSSPIHVLTWIRQHASEMVPPIGHKTIWRDDTYEIVVVRGPNTRRDFHINSKPEIFYQMRGAVTLRLRIGKHIVEQPIQEGELFVLPPHVPHSPQRDKGSWGLVVEQRQATHAFMSSCRICGQDTRTDARPLTSLDVLEDLIRDAEVCVQCKSRL